MNIVPLPESEDFLAIQKFFRLYDHKATREDWSCPGKVYAGVLPKDLNETIHLEILMDDMVQNHGFSKVEWKGRRAALITSALGAFVVTPPVSINSDWNVEKIMGQPISDAAMIDIDGDGEMEIATIEQFHGNYYRIYKKVNHQYQMIYEHEETTEFYHVVKSWYI